MSNGSPGKGLFGWLGRQIGYVKKAMQTDPAGPTKIYRNESIKEQPLPSDPNVTLRRTTIDEVIVDPRDQEDGSVTPRSGSRSPR